MSEPYEYSKDQRKELEKQQKLLDKPSEQLTDAEVDAMSADVYALRVKTDVAFRERMNKPGPQRPQR
jgi:hypothetical protein